jgi:predicted ATP-grasp superfamily ATP-dependent carboligase
LSHELQREHFDLVIPVTDESLLLLHREREFLSRYSRLALPNEQGLEYTHNKIKTIELARECGLATPETQVVCDPTEVNGLEVPDDSPVVLKPAFSYSLVDPYAGRLQVRIVKPGIDFRQRLVDMLRSSPVLVQEFCRGHGVGLSVLGYHGEVLAAFQHERVHEPPEGGASTYRKSMPISPHLFNGVSRMCQSMEWHGPAMFEFKGDASDGRYVLMEINGRFWGSLSLAIEAGVDFPRLLYEMLVYETKAL